METLLMTLILKLMMFASKHTKKKKNLLELGNLLRIGKQAFLYYCLRRGLNVYIMQTVSSISDILSLSLFCTK